MPDDHLTTCFKDFAIEAAQLPDDTWYYLRVTEDGFHLTLRTTFLGEQLHCRQHISWLMLKEAGINPLILSLQHGLNKLDRLRKEQK